MHLLLYMQGVTETTKHTVEEGLKASSCSWWHHLDNIWLVCLGHNSSPAIFDSWYIWLSPLVAQDGGRFLLIELEEGNRLNGLLPEASWNWVRGHLRPCR